MSRLAIIGCGNPTRSDDGVGYHVIRALQEQGLDQRPGISLYDASTDGMAVMFHARGSDELVIVDACVSGGEAGAVYRLPGEELAQQVEEGANLHAFRWDHALYAGRRIFAEHFPRRVTVYLVEAQTLQPGLELSSPVAAAVDTVVAHLCEHIEARAGAAEAHCRLQNGNLYLSGALCGQQLASVNCVALLHEPPLLWLVPLQAAGGGQLLKRRNAQGDRVLHLQAFLRDNALNEWAQAECAARWDDCRAALAVTLPEVVTTAELGQGV